MMGNLRVGGDAAIHNDAQGRKIFFQLIGQLIPQRRNLSVLFGRQTLQPSVACMHDENLAARLTHRAHKIAHKIVAFNLVNTNAMLDCDGQTAP